MRLQTILRRFIFIGMFFILNGCVGLSAPASAQLYPVPKAEAQWIRDGQPLEFEGEMWYPRDDVEILLDNEVYLLGEYKGVQFFVAKTDVRPYHYLYTKFDKNSFRVFKKKRHKDE